MTEKEKKAGEYVMPFGQCEGSPLWKVLSDNPRYFDWLLGKVKSRQFTGREDFQRAILCYGESDSVQRELNTLDD